MGKVTKRQFSEGMKIANKHEKMFTFTSIKEMQIKARYHFSLIKLAKMKMTNIHCWIK